MRLRRGKKKAVNGVPPTAPVPEHKRTRTIDSTKIRLSVLAMLIVGIFVALYSRLWYLQVLATEEFKIEAKNNRVRVVESEPPRGRILDRHGNVLVHNKRSLVVALERDLLESRPVKWTVVLARLAHKLDLKLEDMHNELDNVTISPYKPLPVAYDVPEEKIAYIEEHPEKFPGVVYDTLWSRKVVRGYMAPHILGYTNEISAEELKLRAWKDYDLGDIIGKAGVERTFDEVLRGVPRRQRVVVDAANDPISKLKTVQEEEPGADVMVTIAPRIQAITQQALSSGVAAVRGAGYAGTSGAAVVMDPRNGEVLAMASYPSYDARLLEDGINTKESKILGLSTPGNNTDDSLLNRPIQAPLPPGSTFKGVTSVAALALDVVGAYELVGCPGQFVPPGSFTEFYNWTSADLGSMGFIKALEISCNTFFFNLGWRMEAQWGIPGDGQFQFQRFARSMGFGRETGIRLPYEHGGLVPDPTMCDLPGYCPEGEYLPGYTVNMAVGQGDLLVTPLQMAMAYSAIANGGTVYTPHIVKAIARTDVAGEQEIVREFEPEVQHTLQLDPAELQVVQAGLRAVVSGGGGTANDAFVGFGAADVAGKTGTAQVGESDASHAWFISYAPSTDPRYTVAVYVEKAGHGGDSAAPIAREIYEGIFSRDRDTSVSIQSGSYD